ncbi:MAG TPA: DUF1674 domain-containing protein [Roseiarcus sp.]|nr:DUF1674 domain-containing protein [Roseiarcus sp.]
MSAGNDKLSTGDAGAGPAPFGARILSHAAHRALAEAEARRAQAKPERPREVSGRGGLDPVRYGDWEVKGIASDF